MKILWFTWKDMKHSQAGGAEVVNEELAKRLAKDGHEVEFVVGGYAGCVTTDEREGFKVVRMTGGRFTTYWHTYRYYKKQRQGWADLVIDEVNTIPYFAKFYVKEKNILFIHQLARQIWFYQMFFPLSLIGYLLEPLYLRLLANRSVVTVSESTKTDLLRYGFKAEKIEIISEGIQMTPLTELTGVLKYTAPTTLSLGAVRPMKRTLDIVKAFELAVKEKPELKLIIAGDTTGSYGKKVLHYIAQSAHKESIEILGRVSGEKKVEILQKSHLIAVTSVKEGWGLIVTEANSQGTPAVVYDVDGLRDSVQPDKTGLVCSVNIPEDLATNMLRLLKDQQQYAILRQNAWQWSQQVTFAQSYTDFKKILNI